MPGQVGSAGFGGGGGGSVPANTVPKSNGSNLVPARITDDATDIIIGSNGLPNDGRFIVGDIDANNYIFFRPDSNLFETLVTSEDATHSSDVRVRANDLFSAAALLADGPNGSVLIRGTLGIAQSAPSSTTADLLGNNQISFYLNEAGNKLMAAVKYSDGTAKTGELALT